MGDRSRGTGGGVWCLNTSVLEESEYTEMMRGCVKEQMKWRGMMQTCVNGGNV